MFRLHVFALAAASVVAIAFSPSASAEKKYGPGVTDTEIKIGNIAPYSGPASAFSILGKVQDAYSKKVPQLIVASGASRWNDPKAFPWTMGWIGTFETEARIYGQYLLTEAPASKIAVLYQNDDFGKDCLKGLRAGLQGRSAMIVAEESYETSEPTIDSHIVKLKASGADVFLNFTSPKFAAQAIKKMGELSWRPLHFLSGTSVSIANVIKPAGFENAQNIISSVYLKDPSAAQWADDAGVNAFNQFLSGYFPEGRGEILAALGYT